MSDDWHDPFEEDQSARERARRRAERELRRRERSAETRQSLGEQVREIAGSALAAPPVDTPAEPEAMPPPPPPPPRGNDSRTLWRRRIALLVGLIVVVGLVFAVLSVIAGDDGASEPEMTPAKARKTIDLTIPEGYTRAQMAGLAKDAKLEGDYEKITDSTKLLDVKELQAQDAKDLEGFLFPATYELYKGAKAKTLVRDQLAAFNDNFAQVDMSYAESKQLTPYDVVIIASMIEREIAVPEERKLAASVIYNRLKAGTPLGIDATIRYEDDNFDEPLLESRLNTDTPYNTRINPGLPPGPIGNPGLASLEAAANPAETDYFYYVVKPGTCNEHEFVKTQDEFDAAQAAYDAAREEAGGKSPTDC